MPRILAHSAMLFVAAALPACERAGNSPTPRDEAALRAAIAAYDSAWLSKDAAAVERIISPDYLYFTSRGGLEDRSAMLGFLADTSYVLTRSRRTEVRLTIAGAVARVSSRWEGEGRYRGEPVLDDQTCGMSWMKVDGAWRLFTEHCVNRLRPEAAGDSAS